MSNWFLRATRYAGYINTWWALIAGCGATVVTWLMGWVEPILQPGWPGTIVNGLVAGLLTGIIVWILIKFLIRTGRLPAGPPAADLSDACAQIADLEARNKDLQEQIEGISRQSPPPRINAFAYLRPPEEDSLIIQWDAPVRDQNAAVALDYRPRGEKPRRIVLSSQVSLTERQTVKTVICQPNSRGSWAWKVEGGDEIVIHEGIVMCRLAIIGSDGREHYWRFCIADRTYNESPHVVGENVFEDNFER